MKFVQLFSSFVIAFTLVSAPVVKAQDQAAAPQSSEAASVATDAPVDQAQVADQKECTDCKNGKECKDCKKGKHCKECEKSAKCKHCKNKNKKKKCKHCKEEASEEKHQEHGHDQHPADAHEAKK